MAEVARDYLKRAARIGELNGHPPGSDGPMATALKRCNGGRVLVFVVGAFAEMSGDVSRMQRCRRTRTIRTATSFSTTPRGGTSPLPRRAQPLLLLFRSNPPH